MKPFSFSDCGTPDPIRDSADLLRRSIERNAPLAVVCREDDDVRVFSGPVNEYDRLSDIPRKKFLSSPYEGVRYDTVSIVPYSQIRERGFEAYDDGAKIRCMEIQEQTRTSLQELLGILPDEPIALEQGVTYSMTKQEYARIVSCVQEQIRNGNACNVVIHLKAMAGIAGMSPLKALSILRRLLQREFGAYMTFCFYDGTEYHIGASPERHLTVAGGEVTMNPISGTYRKVNGRIDLEAFRKFLKHPKEQNELFMCMDEELKQMARMCERGGRIIGPLLKEMSHLVHTEYLLVGHSDKDIIELLRTSMHAPTVTGSPQQSACRIIADTERMPRGYYAGELVLIGHDHCNGMEVLDSAIAIRTMAVLPSGLIVLRAGASIVRDSVPEEEAEEVCAKARGALQTLLSPVAGRPEPQLPSIMNEELHRIQYGRNVHLNRYQVEDQEHTDLTVPELKGKSITIINHEDDFVFSLKHMMESMGAVVTVIPFEAYETGDDVSDIVVFGPGPGDPLDKQCPKMRKLEEVTRALRESGRTFLAVCLGHQELCRQLGFSIEKKEVPTQGVQREIDFFGTKELVGNYNSFCAKKGIPVEGMEVCADAESGEIHALRGTHFSSFQFHPESILSKNGFRLLAEELKRLVLKNVALSI